MYEMPVVVFYEHVKFDPKCSRKREDIIVILSNRD